MYLCKLMPLMVLASFMFGPLVGQDHSNHQMMISEISNDEMITPAFLLTNHEGKLVDQTILQGKFSLMGFGFTNCPDVCPMMAYNMSMALELMPENSQGIFISVDTERDTPNVTHQYASNFHPRMMGLSGSYDQISDASTNFLVNYSVTKTVDAYTVQHTSNIYVLGETGQLIDVFSFSDTPDMIANSLHH
jgi:protein SCO1/2